MASRNEAISKDTYDGFEQGPIRPPSESQSLLLRITRNCPWNRCTFCSVYKGENFSLRPVSHILKDIDQVHGHVRALEDHMVENKKLTMAIVNRVRSEIEPSTREAFGVAVSWISSGMESIFIQDANSLIMKPADLIVILEYIKKCFPQVRRITSYARSHTLSKISDADLAKIAHAGMNRIHVGLESASDTVLKMVKKGATKKLHIKAGLKVKNAGMELSEYVMPGLGGQKYSREHAMETADALNQINPDFIRLRTLALPRKGNLAEDFNEGLFQKCTDSMVAEEILVFLETLSGITSYIKSDHILNLLEDIDGEMPDDKDMLCNVVKEFLRLEPESKMYFQVGRRLGIFSKISDLDDEARLKQVKDTCTTYGVNTGNVDGMIDEMMTRFV